MLGFTPAKSHYLFSSNQCRLLVDKRQNAVKRVLKKCNTLRFGFNGNKIIFINVILNDVKFILHKIKIDFLRPEVQSEGQKRVKLVLLPRPWTNIHIVLYKCYFTTIQDSGGAKIS